MNVLITGAGGFIGSHLVEDQLARGRYVKALDVHHSNLERVIEHEHLEIIKGDIRDQELLNKIVPGVDIVFHLASAHLEVSVPDKVYWDVNVEGTKNLLKISYQNKVKRFVHCSSVGVFGDILKPPVNEESPCQPTILYEKTKLAGEKEVLKFHEEKKMPIVVVRPVWVYGPRCPRTLKLFDAIQRGKFFMVGDGQTLRHTIYISDLVEGFELCAQKEEGIGKVYILGDNEAVTLDQLVNEIARILQVKKPARSLPVWLMFCLGMGMELVSKFTGKEPPFSRRSLKFFTNNTAFDTSKIRRELGFEPRFTLSEGLREFYKWYKIKTGQILNTGYRVKYKAKGSL